MHFKPIFTLKRPHTDNHHRLFRLYFISVRLGEFFQIFRCCSRMMIRISQVNRLTNHRNGNTFIQPCFANARIDQSRLMSRVNADEDNRIRLFQPCNRAIKAVASLVGDIKLRPINAAFQLINIKRTHERF